jgi:hypothetical protein
MDLTLIISIISLKFGYQDAPYPEAADLAITSVLCVFDGPRPKGPCQDGNAYY